MKVSVYGSTILTLGVLKAIHQKSMEEKVHLAYVVTQPASPFGRKKELKNNIVAQYCIDNNIKFYTPEKISDLFTNEELEQSDSKLKVDIAVVAAYGKILKKKILETARFGFMNFHPSLLPKYRGALPPQMTILNQDEIGGLTIQKMGEGMDDGEIISNYQLTINKNITFGELLIQFAELSEAKIDEDFDYLFSPEKWDLKPQDDSLATYCYEKDFTKERLEIHYEDGVKLAHGKVMAANPEPVASLRLQISDIRYQLNILRSYLDPEGININLKKSGELSFHELDRKLYLELSNGFLEILEIQPAGKNVMDAKSFLNGNRKLINDQQLANSN
jgi:methionyl-tRNA formyltransferase